MCASYPHPALAQIRKQKKNSLQCLLQLQGANQCSLNRIYTNTFSIFAELVRYTMVEYLRSNSMMSPTSREPP